MRKLVVAVVVGLGIVAAVWWLGRRSAPTVPTPAVATALPSERAGPRGSAVEGEPIGSTSDVEARRAARNRMRQRVVDALHARDRAAQDDAAGASPSGSTGSPPATDDEAAGSGAPPPDATDGGPDAPGGAAGLIDRTGSHEYLVEVMNEDLMPLAEECYTLALDDQPDLAGLLVLDFEIIGGEEIGGVIEAVAAGEGNELADPDLFECMRESILATTLPAPEHSGRDRVSLSLRLSPDEGQGDAK